MSERELQDAMDRVGASMRRALKAEWRRMAREGRAREAAYREWLGRALPAIADELTETLPPEMRAAGIRFEWTEETT